MLLAATATATAGPSWVLIVFAGITALSGIGGLAALFYVRATNVNLKAQARKAGVEADVAMSGQALEWMREWRDESAAAKKESRECSEKVDALMDHITEVLEPIMREKGMKPPPFVWPRP